MTDRRSRRGAAFHFFYIVFFKENENCKNEQQREKGSGKQVNTVVEGVWMRLSEV